MKRYARSVRTLRISERSLILQERDINPSWFNSLLDNL